MSFELTSYTYTSQQEGLGGEECPMFSGTYAMLPESLKPRFPDDMESTDKIEVRARPYRDPHGDGVRYWAWWVDVGREMTPRDTSGERWAEEDVWLLLKDLDALVSYLNDFECSHEGVEFSELPTFGGHEPDDCQGVFSWDKQRVMYLDGEASLRLRWKHECPGCEGMDEEERLEFIWECFDEGKPHLGTQLLRLLDDDLLASLETKLQGFVRSLVHKRKPEAARLVMSHIKDAGFKAAYVLEPRT